MKLNEETVKSLPVPETGNKVHFFTGAVLQGKAAPSGFGVRVTANGARAFILNYRNSSQQERRITIGLYPDWSVLAAVREARQLRQRIDRGEDPLADRRKVEAASRDTLKNIMDEFFAREGGKLKSAEPRKRMLERLVIPEIGNRDIASIKRSEIIRLLDAIADTSGAVSANRVKAYLSRVFNWYAGRSDEFRSPFVRGMPYGSGDEEPRQRILDDTEIRAVWKAAKGPYGALAKFILLTGARRSEAAGMPREEIKDGVWLLPADAGPGRNKVALALARPLGKQALAATQGIGRYVFSLDGGATPIDGSLSRLHGALLKASGTSGWTLHDLRRTARSLMSRAKVPTDHAEKCLGHMVGKIRKTYDVWEYLPEKAHAYAELASLIERIVNPPAANVMPIKAVRHG
jgi:integrase